VATAKIGAAVRLPNFVVVGAAKCGTTSLFHYLKQHPDVFLPAKKELHYFAYDQLSKNAGGPGGDRIRAFACATREEYETHYREAGGHVAIGDISPSYFYYAEARERIKAELNGPKIVILLRDPIQKAHSQYMHLVRDNLETLPFFDALMSEPERTASGWTAMWRYAESSLYYQRVRSYLEVFGEERVRIYLFEELSKNPEPVLETLFEFLGVSPRHEVDTGRVYNRSGQPRSRLLADFLTRSNPVTAAARRLLPEDFRDRIKNAMLNLNTGPKDAIDDRSRAYLRGYFADHVRKLERLLGRELGWLSR
jgi:Sulfotransferase family